MDDVPKALVPSGETRETPLPRTRFEARGASWYARGMSCSDNCCGCDSSSCSSRRRRAQSANPLLKFSAALFGVTPGPSAFPCDLADAGFTECVPEGSVVPGLPFPTYPAAKRIVLSSLSVDVQVAVPVTSPLFDLFFTLLVNGTPAHPPLAYDTLAAGHNTKTLAFTPVTVNVGDRVTLRCSCSQPTIPPGAPTLGISATAG